MESKIVRNYTSLLKSGHRRVWASNALLSSNNMTKFIYSRNDERDYPCRFPMNNEMLAKYTFPHCAIKQHSLFPGLYLPKYLRALHQDLYKKWDVGNKCYGEGTLGYIVKAAYPNGLNESMCQELVELLNNQDVIAFYQMKQEFENDQT